MEWSVLVRLESVLLLLGISVWSVLLLLGISVCGVYCCGYGRCVWSVLVLLGSSVWSVLLLLWSSVCGVYCLTVLTCPDSCRGAPTGRRLQHEAPTDGRRDECGP